MFWYILSKNIAISCKLNKKHHDVFYKLEAANSVE